MSICKTSLAPLSEWCASFSLGREERRSLTDRIFTSVADWSAAAISGCGHPLYSKYIGGLAPTIDSGICGVIGTGKCAPVLEAAATNAAISHLWEVDDVHRQSTSHPGVTVLPAVIAVAQSLADIDPERCVEAMVVGYEMTIRVGAFLGKEHYSVCHTTATAGAFGAAAATSRLLGLDATQTLSAFGHAGTQAAGLWQFHEDGADQAKAFHAALAVRNGVTGALLAKAGIPGATRILEGSRGMLAAWHLAGENSEWLTPAPSLLINRVTIKKWPTCGQMHSALDCAEHMVLKGIQSSRIKNIQIDVPRSCLGIAGLTDPSNVSEAKFSTAFCISAMLTGRRPDISGLTQDLLMDASVHRLANKVELKEDLAFTQRFPNERPARVVVTMDDGAIHSEERSVRQGDPELAWSKEEFVARVKDIVTLSGRQVDADTLIDWCQKLAEGNHPDWAPATLFQLASRRSEIAA